MGLTYQQFVERKATIAEPPKRITAGELHPSLFPHQRDAVRWALERGCALVAARFGLGKSRINIQIAKTLVESLRHPYLIVSPLGVRHQFITEDGPAMATRWQYVKTDEEIRNADTPFLITNYERIREGCIDPRKVQWSGVGLDEGNVLRSLGSKTYHVFDEAFEHVDYKYVFTATPSPNRYRELIYYANWLGVMDCGQALTRWFKRNPSKAGDLTLHPQHEEAFWLWVASWALFLYSPADLGYDDTGYDLPELRVHWHKVAVDHSKAWQTTDDRGQHRLIAGTQHGVSTTAKEKRDTLGPRLEKAREILAAASADTHWLVWHHLEDERKAIEHEIPEAVTVYGSQDLERREQYILDFAHGRIRVLASKPELTGSGCNFQRYCHSNIFLGINFEFDSFIQAIHRTQRFQQAHPVDVHIIYAETEAHVVATLKQKWAQHDQLAEKMRAISREYGLSHAALSVQLKRSIGIERIEHIGERFTAVRNDCVDEVRRFRDDSVDLIHTSIPFGNHYEYSTQVEDFGHNPSDAAFFEQMDYALPDWFRVLKPGRIAAIHVKDRVLYGHQTASGFMEIAPFSPISR